MFMSLYYLIFIIYFVIVCAQTAVNGELELDSVWEEFKSKYKKSYSPLLEARSRLAWEENFLKIQIHNSEAAIGLHNYTLKDNHLTDMTLDKYLKEMVRLLRSRHRKTEGDEAMLGASQVDVPDELDWRDKGFITPPLNQEDCGSCYAFSIGTAVQAQAFKRDGDLTPLSVQQIVDCSTRNGNMGCRGGSIRNTMRYIKEQGLMTHKDYPYKAEKSVCKYSKEDTVVTITDWKVLPPGDEEALKSACALIGPVPISINASPHTFQFYHDGVYDDVKCSSNTLNHAMLLVGYTKNAWILKNWWSEHWGQNGYMYLARGQNRCGVANYAAYVVV